MMANSVQRAVKKLARQRSGKRFGIFSGERGEPSERESRSSGSALPL